MKIGYACDKFNDYAIELQLKALKRYGCKKIYKCSGFLDLVYFIKPDDIIVIFHMAVLGSVAVVMVMDKLLETRKISDLICLT